MLEIVSTFTYCYSAGTYAHQLTGGKHFNVRTWAKQRTTQVPSMGMFGK